MNQFLRTRKSSFTWVGVLIVVMIAVFSCSKEGTQEVIPDFSKLTIEVKSLKLAPVLYSIKLDDFTVEDSAVVMGRYSNAVERTDGKQRLKITEIYSNSVLLDTMLTIEKGESIYTVYQIDTTESAKPLFIAGGGESDLPVDTFMQAFYANDPLLPAVFDIYVYKIVDFTYAEVPPIHIYRNVKKGEFSEFHPFYIGDFYMTEIRTPDGEMVRDMLPIDPLNPFSGGGLLDTRCDFVNNHQIVKLGAVDGGGVNTYYLECMFMY